MRIAPLLGLAVVVGILTPSDAQAQKDPHAGFQRGTVIMKDTRQYKDVYYKVRGRNCIIRRKYGNTWNNFPVPMRDVEKIIPKEEEETKGGDAAPTATVWSARFTLEPPKNWEVVRPANPLVQAQLRHTKKDATLSVSVWPRKQKWKIQRPTGRTRAKIPADVPEGIKSDLALFYSNIPRPQVEVGELHGGPVYRIKKLTVIPVGGTRDDSRYVTEVRFRRHGYEYAVSYSVSKADDGALKHTVEDVLRSFTFLPTMDIGDSHYSDFARGFSLKTPNISWRIDAQPFSRSRPLVLKTPKERGVLEVHRYKNTTESGLVVREMMNKRKAKNRRHFSHDKIYAGKKSGVEITKFRFRDHLNPDDVKKQKFRGFAVPINGDVLLFIGHAPISDRDASKIQDELKGILKSVKLLNDADLKTRVESAVEAMHHLSKGAKAAKEKRHEVAITHYDRAIERESGFALAWFLRGLAKRSNFDFKGFKADLEQADKLAPGQGFGKPLAGARRDEAKAAQGRKSWPLALRLWVGILKNDTSNEEARKAVIDCIKQYWRQEKGNKNYLRPVKVIEGHLKGRPLNKDVQVVKALVGVYKDAANTLMRTKKYRDAKKFAKSIIRFGKSLKDTRMRQEGERLYDQIRKRQG